MPSLWSTAGYIQIRRFGKIKLHIIIILSAILALSCERVDVFTVSSNRHYTYMAVGSSGQVWQTTDIDSGVWTDITSTTSYISGIIKGKPGFIIIGGSYPPVNSGFIRSSTDGTNWTDLITSGSSYCLRGIITGPVLLAFGDDSGTKVTWTSSDGGSSWTSSATIPDGIYNSTFNLKAAAYGGGYFVIVGGYSSNGETMRSTDGLSWTVTSPSCDYLNGIAYADGRFVTVGRSGIILYSIDNGSTWTSAGAYGSDHNSVVYAAGKLVAVGTSGQVYDSTDGITWSSQTSNVSTNLLHVTWLYDRFMAVGSSGTIIHSKDGITWTDASPGGSSTLYGVTAW